MERETNDATCCHSPGDLSLPKSVCLEFRSAAAGTACGKGGQSVHLSPAPVKAGCPLISGGMRGRLGGRWDRGVDREDGAAMHIVEVDTDTHSLQRKDVMPAG